MKDLPIHLLLFAWIALAIVLLAGAYAEPEERPLWRALPRRYLVFVLGCVAVAALMLVCEHTFARV